MTHTTVPNKILTCIRSGLPLAKITTLCSNGWPLLGHPTFNSMVHPVYGFPLDKLLIRLTEQLDEADSASFMLEAHELTEIGLTMSAIMHDIDAFWLPSKEAAYKQEPSLPCEAIVFGCASRLLSLASWYHHATSKRMDFPRYRVSSANNNLGWDNYKSWLDSAFEIKEDWEDGRKELNEIKELRSRTAALHTVSAASMMKRIDFAKVWNWIDIQLVKDGRYAAGRRETFKTIFMRGDANPEDWTTDDVEDIQLAIVECCDVGNEINFFINNRLNNIKAMILDFYSSFTLLTHSVSDTCATLDMTAEEQARSGEFFASFDQRATALSEMPAAPKRESFTSLGLFLKAQAQHNILAKRYDMQQAQQAKQAAASPAPVLVPVAAVVDTMVDADTINTNVIGE